MPNVICNTSPIQYLYQLDLLNILRSLAGNVIVPPAVVDELEEGRALGMSLPDLTVFDWVTVRRPVSELAVPLVTNLGAGETEVLMLALELREAVVVVDDGLRTVASAKTTRGPAHKIPGWLMGCEIHGGVLIDTVF